MKKIVILTTGGTIEKAYNELEGSLDVSEFLIKSFVLDKLRLPYTQYELRPLMAKDSLTMVEKDRQVICQAIHDQWKKEKTPILVVHGTDTMELTAAYCYEHLNHPPAPVVFTGSMKPIGFEDTDGKQNITEALMACKLLAPGIYVSFHGEVFQVPNVTKDRKERTFTKKSSS